MQRLAPVFLGLAMLASQASGQEQERVVTPGAPATIALDLKPTVQDRLEIQTNDSSLLVSVELPGGARITDWNSRIQGLRVWRSDFPLTGPGPAPTERPLTTRFVIEFSSRGNQPGVYRVLLDGSRIQKAARARVSFQTGASIERQARAGEWKEILATQGTIFVAERKFAAGSQAVIDLALPEGPAGDFLDVAMSHAGLPVSLETPQAVRLTAANASQAGLEWKSVAKPADADPPGSWLSSSRFLIPHAGPHTIVTWKGRRAAGRWRVHIDGSKAGTEFTAAAALVPLGRQIESPLTNPLSRHPTHVVAAFDFSRTPGPLGPGPVPLTLLIQGPPFNPQLHIRSRVEIIGESSKRTMKPLNLAFTKTAGGVYRTTYVPAFSYAEGESTEVHEIWTIVSGRLASGAEFHAEANTRVHVRPTVGSGARIEEQLVDWDRNGKPDALYVIARFQVEKAGEYSFVCRLRNRSTREDIWDSVTANLSTGPQALTTRFSAEKIKRILGEDGPYDTSFELSRGDGRAGDFVRLPESYTTRAYRLADWDRAEFKGTSSIRVKPIAANGSSKPNRIRVEWDVITPGGECTWSGSMVPDSRRGAHILAQGSGRLRPGPVTLNFDFPSGVIAQRKIHSARMADLYEVICNELEMIIPPADKREFKTPVIDPAMLAEPE